MEPAPEDNLDNILQPGQVISLVISSPKEKQKRAKITPEIKTKIDELLTEGKSVRQVASLLKISKSTVSTLGKKSAEIKSEVATETMDDAAFARTINPVQMEPEATPEINKAEKNRLLSKFMTSLTPDPKAPRQKRKAPVPELLSVLAEPEEDKSVVIAKIQMNVDNFPDILKDYIKPDRDTFLAKVNKMSSGDLTHTLNLLQTVRSSTNMANQLKYLLFGATGIIEMGTQRFLGMKTRGYADMVRQQEAEIQSCLREIAINNVESYKKVERPEMRLATVLVTTLLATDARNRMEQVRTEFKTAPVNEQTEQQFADM
jgi:predicted transcriptional regulator